ncbi:MAG: aconitase X [Candidatus Korarchaeum sp.]|nr:aconitase X [Candidatus Korarchaeum sp.]MDW8035549.1 aconitase X [Candidatus Korarchaeum sp.]
MTDEITITLPISWLDGIDIRTGRIVQEDHPQRGQSIAGKIVRIRGSTGSTVGAYVFFALKRNNVAPNKIILEEPDSVTISAELAGIPVEISGAKEVRLEDRELKEELRRYLEREASITGAQGFARIRSVHISGVSYATIGDAGREWLSEVSREIRFKVTATTNPAGMDLVDWRTMGIPEDFARRQIEIVDSLVRMGALPTFTCTPYLTGNLPAFGERVCWGESSAVAFINSALGARSNREGATKTVVTAATGYTPIYGKHLDENRLPNIKIDTEPLENTLQYYLLAYYVGLFYPDSVPLYEGLKSASLPELKAMSAAGAASGSIELFHVPGVTPNRISDVSKSIRVTKKDLIELREGMSSFEGGSDLVVLGCPHLSLQELKEIKELLMGRRALIRFWIFTARAFMPLIERSGIREALERFGARIWYDTCMVVSPLEELGVRKVTTNSTKAAKYLKSLRKLDVELLDVKEIVERYSAPS